MQGRFHPYEGYTNDQIALPIRVMKCLGVEHLLLSNAAGGLNEKFNVGDLVLLVDHLNIPGLALNNVLVGPNEDKFGTRFPDLSTAYNKELRNKFLDVAKEHKCANLIHQGVYAFCGGPTYETPAECRYLRMIGADVVGMSTVPEVIVAHHCGIKLMAVSLVTNKSNLSNDTVAKACHQDVLDIATNRAELLQKVFVDLIGRI